MCLNTLLSSPLKSIKGFTLVELSIVIVIIGLIIAGVTAGQSLVNSAKLRTITSDTNLYKAAYNSFRLQYNAIPGDMPNAFDYWGAATGCTNNDVNSVAGGCNGNSNKQLAGPNVTNNSPEDKRAWQFLALSGLIAGQYSGSGGYAIGSNIPAANYSKSVGMTFSYMTTYYRYTAHALNTTNSGNFSHNYLTFTKIRGGRMSGGAITTSDAFNLDIKIDDGLPMSGVFLAFTGNPVSGGPEDPVVNHCATTNTYILTHNVVACAIIAQMDF